MLLATGRRPATDEPALDRAGIKSDDHGYIVVDEKLRTSVPDVYAAMPRPKIVGQTYGLIKIIVDAATDHILGATLFCVALKRSSTPSRPRCAPAPPRPAS